MHKKKDKENILFFNKSTIKVVELIFNHPRKIFHLRMLGKDTGLSTTAINSAIEKLWLFKICKIETTALTKNVQANIESEEYRFYKKIFNLYRIERWGLLGLLKQEFQNPEGIILFGSFSRGEDTEESDIDLLVLTKKEVNIDTKLKIYEKEFNRKINIITLPSLEKSENSFKNTVANGIVLHGYLKVV